MSANIGGLRFCSECNNLMKPIEGYIFIKVEKILTFICRCCDFREEVKEH